MKRVVVVVRLPKPMVEEIDRIAEATNKFRTDIVIDFLQYALDHAYKAEEEPAEEEDEEEESEEEEDEEETYSY